MKCRKIMKTEICSVSMSDTIQDAACAMREGEIGFLPVLDAEGLVCGTVTDRDLAIRGVALGCSPATLLSDVMTWNVISCDPDEELAVAEALMSKKQVARIMCIESTGRL